jgi:hypothetical protein
VHGATGWIAIYAAAVSTGSLGWQIWTHQRAKRPQVTVLLDGWRTNQVPGRRSLEEATVRIRNREDHTVWVDKVYFRYPWTIPSQGSPVPAMIDSGDVSEVPFDVPAREVRSFTLRPTKDYKFPAPQSAGREFTPLVAVELRTGERYTSLVAERQS